MQMVNRDQIQEGETIPKDVWGAGERKMYFRTSVSRVISRAEKFKKIGISESNTLHELFFWRFLITIIPNSIWRAFSYIISTMIWFSDLIPIFLNFTALEMTRETDVRKYIFLHLGP